MFQTQKFRYNDALFFKTLYTADEKLVTTIYVTTKTPEQGKPRHKVSSSSACFAQHVFWNRDEKNQVLTKNFARVML